LLSSGARVRIAQRDPRTAWFLKPLGGLGQTQFAAVDVRNPDTVIRIVRGSDAVVNLAGILSGNFQGVHVTGSRNVAEAAAAAGVPALVHVSAIGADPESPSAYGRSKGEGEAAVRAAFPAATILRPSIMFGPEDHFINRFAGMIASAPIVPVLRAEAKFQPVYVRDVARAATTVLARQGAGQDAGNVRDAGTARDAGGAMFELGGPDILSMGRLIRWIATAIGRDPMIVELPDQLGGLIALGGFLPGAPITLDQWRMLQRDNVVAAGANGLAALGVSPTPLDAVAPDWLVRYRRHGRFGARVVA
jgi:NADH dehydrogenase